MDLSNEGLASGSTEIKDSIQADANNTEAGSVDMFKRGERGLVIDQE